MNKTLKNRSVKFEVEISRDHGMWSFFISRPGRAGVAGDDYKTLGEMRQDMYAELVAVAIDLKEDAPWP